MSSVKWGCNSTPTPFPSVAIARAEQQKQIKSPSGGPPGALGEARVAGRKALPTPQAESNWTGRGKGALRSGTPFIETVKRCHDKPGSRPLTIQDRAGGNWQRATADWGVIGGGVRATLNPAVNDSSQGNR